MIHRAARIKALVVELTAVIVFTIAYVGGLGSFDVLLGVGIVLLAAVAIVRDLR